MRPAIYFAAAVAVAAIAPDISRTILADAASVVLESLPFLAASTLLGRFGPFAGCGCGNGPSARSLPALLASALLFGIPASAARFAAACAVAHAVRSGDEHAHADLLAELQRIAPAALLAAIVAVYGPALPLHALPPVLAFIAGAFAGAVASPCALGGVALAASLRTTAPLAAAGVLCTAGVVDIYALRVLVARRSMRARRDAPRRLVRASDVHAAARGDRVLLHRALAAALIGAIVLGAPAPAYRATETTLGEAFPGERVDFTGVAVHKDGANALVRYAIMCCRADARPVTLAIDRDLAREDGRWLHARGVLEAAPGGTLRLRVQHIAEIAAPSDPFVYR